jgi:hypothetical protein
VELLWKMWGEDESEVLSVDLSGVLGLFSEFRSYCCELKGSRIGEVVLSF